MDHHDLVRHPGEHERHAEQAGHCEVGAQGATAPRLGPGGQLNSFVLCIKAPYYTILCAVPALMFWWAPTSGLPLPP